MPKKLQILRYHTQTSKTKSLHLSKENGKQSGTVKSNKFYEIRSTVGL